MQRRRIKIKSREMWEEGSTAEERSKGRKEEQERMKKTGAR